MPIRSLMFCVMLLAGCGPVVKPAGPPVTTPSLEDQALIVRDGTRLPLRHWQAGGTARGVVIALHGYTDYSASFDRLGPWLADLGFDTYAYDQRGFGGAPHPGIWPGSEALTGDLIDAIEAVRSSRGDPPLPLFIVGESMGGSVAMAAVAEMDEPLPAGLILAAPGVREDLPYRRFWDAAFWTAAHLAPSYTVTVSRDGNTSLNAPTERRLRDDPHVIRNVRADSYYGVVKLADRASQAAYAIEIPVLMLHGGKDTLIKRISIEAAFEALPGDKTLRLYPEAPHLLLHWDNPEPMLDDVRLWLETQIPLGDTTS